MSRGSVREVFAAFAKLGLTSFGGPIAHLGYFRRELVERRRWVSDPHYAQLLALSQFLPGPSSSQLVFALGLFRAGWRGALVAFGAFTLPSALLMFAFATVLPGLSRPAGLSALHGLKLVALAVVARGVVGMTRKLCPDAPRRFVAGIAAVILLASDSAWMQLVVIALGGLAGVALGRSVRPAGSNGMALPYGPARGWTLLAVFALLLGGLPLASHSHHDLLAVADAFYRAGALVFGGGHVVLPLLEETVVRPGWISRDDFLAGYGAAQAVPGPMFTLASYLGARLPGSLGGALGACVALAAIFLPGFLLVAGVLPLWSRITGHPRATRAVAGINAAVVGLLAAALYDPVWKSAARDPVDVTIALIGFLLLWRVPALVVVVWCVVASVGKGIAL